MSQKKVLDESFAIDTEWKRIEKEDSGFRALDKQLDDEMDAYNAKVKELNKSGGSTPEQSRQLKEMKAAFDKKAAGLIERQRRLLYDIDEVNKRSKIFNENCLQSGIEPKTIKRFQYSSNGEVLAPQPYKKGEPLGAAAPQSPQKSNSPQRSSQPEKISPQVKTRSLASGASGGASSKPSSNPVEESKNIELEWVRIDKKKADIAAEDKRLNEEMNKLNARVDEVNKMNNNSAQIAELNEWQARFDAAAEASVVEKRHLLYDIDLINARAQAWNDATGKSSFPPKPIRMFSYSHNREKLTPLPYGN